MGAAAFVPCGASYAAVSVRQVCSMTTGGLLARLRRVEERMTPAARLIVLTVDGWEGVDVEAERVKARAKWEDQHGPILDGDRVIWFVVTDSPDNHRHQVTRVP